MIGVFSLAGEGTDGIDERLWNQVVALFLNLNYILLAGVKPKDISVNRAYQCEQGQNWTMIVSELALLATVSWAVWSVDSLPGLF